MPDEVTVADSAPTDTQFRALAAKAAAILNRAFAADPSAMHSLSSYRVPCNQSLADDQNIVVDQIPVLPTGPCFAVGMIGVIVGMFQAMGFPCTVASQWSDEKDADGRVKMVGFSLVEVSHCQPGQPGDRSAEKGGVHA